MDGKVLSEGTLTKGKLDMGAFALQTTGASPTAPPVMSAVDSGEGGD